MKLLDLYFRKFYSHDCYEGWIKTTRGRITMLWGIYKCLRGHFGFHSDWEVPLKFNGEGPEMLILLQGAG